MNLSPSSYKPRTAFDPLEVPYASEAQPSVQWQSGLILVDDFRMEVESGAFEHSVAAWNLAVRHLRRAEFRIQQLVACSPMDKRIQKLCFMALLRAGETLLSRVNADVTEMELVTLRLGLQNLAKTLADVEQSFTQPHEG